MTDYIIIVAGGKGLRMGSDIPKQFLPIEGIPVLMRTIRRFHEYAPGLGIILVLPTSQQAYWQELCHKYQFDIPCTIADGGETRFHSVSNGLACIPDDAQGVVGVHDGVRPFPAIEVISRCYETARTTGAAIPVVPVVETLRKMEADGSSQTVPRIPAGTDPADLRYPTTETCLQAALLRCLHRRCLGGGTSRSWHQSGGGQP